MDRNEKLAVKAESKKFWAIAIAINNVDLFSIVINLPRRSVLWSLRWFWRISYRRK